MSVFWWFTRIPSTKQLYSCNFCDSIFSFTRGCWYMGKHLATCCEATETKKIQFRKYMNVQPRLRMRNRREPQEVEDTVSGTIFQSDGPMSSVASFSNRSSPFEERLSPIADRLSPLARRSSPFADRSVSDLFTCDCACTRKLVNLQQALQGQIDSLMTRVEVLEGKFCIHLSSFPFSDYSILLLQSTWIGF